MNIKISFNNSAPQSRLGKFLQSVMERIALWFLLAGLRRIKDPVSDTIDRQSVSNLVEHLISTSGSHLSRADLQFLAAFKEQHGLRRQPHEVN